MTLQLEQLNKASNEEALQLLDGLYEHSPWIAEGALKMRPFASWAHLKHCMAQVLSDAGREAQIGLIRAHPELAGKAMVRKELTAESTNEQTKAGLTECTAEEFEKIHKLNAAYKQKFGWPFILAVRGPRGVGLNKHQIIASFERRLHGHPDFELAECLRNIHRIVEIRLNDKTGCHPDQGDEVWDWHEALAQHSDPGFKENGQLTVTYLTQAHLACSASIQSTMKSAGFDEVYVDAVGNVVGRYHPAQDGAKYLLTGSHYDTVRNGGKYDGRLGIYVPIACVKKLASTKSRLKFGIEVVAFAEEEGQRYKATFLGSGALVGQFNPAWLDQMDVDGVSMREAMKQAGLNEHDIPKIQRNPADYLGFIEVHIEQGPVLNEMNLPLGVVSSINGSVRYLCEMIWTAAEMQPQRLLNWRCSWKSAPLKMVTRLPRLANSKCPMARSTWCLANAFSRWTCARPPTHNGTRLNAMSCKPWTTFVNVEVWSANAKQPCAPRPHLAHPNGKSVGRMR